MTTVLDFTPRVLRNKGVPVTLALISERSTPPDPPQVVERDDGSLAENVVWLKATANVIADIEERFGSLDGFCEALRAKSMSTIRAFIAIVLGLPDSYAGAIMFPERLEEYGTAVTAALALAQGVDPTSVARLIEEGVRLMPMAAAVRTKEVDDLLAQIDSVTRQAANDSTGPGSGDSGSEPDSSPERSGSTAPPKSPSLSPDAEASLSNVEVASAT